MAVARTLAFASVWPFEPHTIPSDGILDVTAVLAVICMCQQRLVLQDPAAVPHARLMSMSMPSGSARVFSKSKALWKRSWLWFIS